MAGKSRDVDSNQPRMLLVSIYDDRKFGSRHGRGSDRSERQSKALLHCTRNHRKRLGLEVFAYLRAAEMSAEEASGRAACSIKRAPVEE